MKKYNLILGILICITLILSVGRVVVSNRISTSGLILDGINDKINFYKTQNDILSEKLLSLSSFSNLSTTAAKLGFVDGKNSFVLTSPLPLASR